MVCHTSTGTQSDLSVAQLLQAIGKNGELEVSALKFNGDVQCILNEKVDGHDANMQAFAITNETTVDLFFLLPSMEPLNLMNSNREFCSLSLHWIVKHKNGSWTSPQSVEEAIHVKEECHTYEIHGAYRTRFVCMGAHLVAHICIDTKKAMYLDAIGFVLFQHKDESHGHEAYYKAGSDKDFHCPLTSLFGIKSQIRSILPSFHNDNMYLDNFHYFESSEGQVACCEHVLPEKVVILIFSFTNIGGIHWGVSSSAEGAWEYIDHKTYREETDDLINGPALTCFKKSKEVGPNCRFTEMTPVTNTSLNVGVVQLYPGSFNLVEGKEYAFKFVLKAGDVWIKGSQGRDFTVAPVARSLREAILLHKEQETAQKNILLEAERIAKEKETAEMKGALDLFFKGVNEKRNSVTQEPYTLPDELLGVSGDICLATKTYEVQHDLGWLNVSVLQDNRGLMKLCVDGCLKEAFTIHWGLLVAPDLKKRTWPDWVMPATDMQPPMSKKVNEKAIQTPLIKGEKGFEYSLVIPLRSTQKNEGGVTLCVPNSFTCGDQDVFPDSFCFILYDGGDRWIKDNNNNDFIFSLNPYSSMAAITEDPTASRIHGLEVKSGGFSLMHRMENIEGGIKSILRDSSSLSSSSAADWAWFLVWARASHIRLLTWQRNYNTKPKDLAWSIHQLTCYLSHIWAHNEKSELRPWPRMVLSQLPRGGGNGQAIRDEILVIFHSNGISERAGHFYEQWHQKLHNNTTPDDVVICQALIRYLESGGDMNRYKDHIYGNGLSFERMASYERAITHMPYMVPNTGKVINDFKHYLGTLKSVHEASDLGDNINIAAQYMSHDHLNACRKAMDMYNNQGSTFDTCLSIGHARKCAHWSLKDRRGDNSLAVREILRLDLSLEELQSIAVANTVIAFRKGGRHEGQLRGLITLIVSILECVEFEIGSQELAHITIDLKELGALDYINVDSRIFRDSREAKLMVLSLIDRTCIWLGDLCQATFNELENRIEFFNRYIFDPENCRDASQFVEEYVRGTFMSSLGSALNYAQAVARVSADLGSWNVISRIPDKELFCLIRYVHEFEEQTDNMYAGDNIFVLCDRMEGTEDIPKGVKGILVLDGAKAPNMLSHCAVRARNEGVLLMSLFENEVDGGKKMELLQFRDATCKIKLGTDQSLAFERCEKAEVRALEDSKNEVAMNYHTADIVRGVIKNMFRDTQKSPRNWTIKSSEFCSAVVGSKSMKLQELRNDLQSSASSFAGSFDIPVGFAVPYSIMSDVVRESGMVKEVLSKKYTQGGDILEACNRFIAKMELRPEIVESILHRVHENGLTFNGHTASAESIWKALCECWASVFAMRPYSCISKHPGMKFEDVQMSVLVQKLYNPELSFVLHTKDITSDDDCIVGEIAFGLGEAIVSNEVGHTMAWKYDRNSNDYTLSSFPSKSFAQMPSSKEALIFRSDSNSEDREDFPGAGLFESVPTDSNSRLNISYSRGLSELTKGFIWNEECRSQIIRSISMTGIQIESIFGMAMDIEGCVILANKASPQKDIRICIVQARPQ